MSTASGEPIRIRRLHVAATIGLLVVGALILRSCRTQRPGTPEPPAPAAEPGLAALPASAEPDAFLPRRAVTLFLPSVDAAALREVQGEIYATVTATDQAKQLVGQLLSAPAFPGTLAPFPPQTALRALLIDKRGTAYVSLSREARGPATEGSLNEQLAVWSLVNTLTRSMREIRHVQILVEGQEVETLSGHVALARPLGFDSRLVAPAP